MHLSIFLVLTSVIHGPTVCVYACHVYVPQTHVIRKFKLSERKPPLSHGPDGTETEQEGICDATPTFYCNISLSNSLLLFNDLSNFLSDSLSS